MWGYCNFERPNFFAHYEEEIKKQEKRKEGELSIVTFSNKAILHR